MKARRDKHFRLSLNLVAEFKRLASILGFSEAQAAEIALQEWVTRNRDEAQKKLDLYAEKGITLIEPQTVNIAVFRKAEILLATEELRRVIENFERGNPEYKHDLQLEMAKALKCIQPIYNRTEDPELLRLLRKIENHL